jgi:hypothetical protein
MKRFAAKLKFFLVRLPVREALAFTALYGKHGTFPVCDVAGVVTEIEFREIAVQVLLCTMLIVAPHSALKNAEEAFR